MAKEITLENLLCNDCGKNEGTVTLNNRYEKPEVALRNGNTCDNCREYKRNKRRNRRR